nr:L10-interacting MYB domain-containing protein-like [Tanacetum cinerariifolium]
MMRMLMEEKKDDDMGACIEMLDKVGWAAQDPMYDTAHLLFGQSAYYRNLLLHLKPESCGNWVKSVGRNHGDVCLSWRRWGEFVRGRGSGGDGLESKGNGVMGDGGKTG